MSLPNPFNRSEINRLNTTSHWLPMKNGGPKMVPRLSFRILLSEGSLVVAVDVDFDRSAEVRFDLYVNHGW